MQADAIPRAESRRRRRAPNFDAALNPDAAQPLGPGHEAPPPVPGLALPLGPPGSTPATPRVNFADVPLTLDGPGEACCCVDNTVR